MKVGTHYKITQLLFIIIAWVIFGFVIAVYDHLVLHTSNSLGTSEQYSFLISAARNMGAGLIGALLGGSFLVFYVNVTYQDKPYGVTILYVFISFILIVAFITLMMGLVLVPLRTDKPLTDPASVSELLNFVSDSHPLKSALVWSIIVAITQLMLQLN
ncbi:MAG: adenylate/guanylate cyclase domain-containing protein, partial [Marivirga sp.]|nr:adenylate/guanylate cyclase domain-containing protein [Marivirga sp.]